MIYANTCNQIDWMSLLDYAYLALNVYYNHHDLKLLGLRPTPLYNFSAIAECLQNNKAGWYHLQLPQVRLNPENAFYADFYIKINARKIHHIAVAIRGTVLYKISNDIEDLKTWWKSILFSHHTALNDPSFLGCLQDFLSQCAKVIKQLKQLQFTACFCHYHITGHSLGGALANLACASDVYFVDDTYDVISFDAPGIRHMQHVHTDTYHEHQVISMRATYDFASTISDPYGYVININIPKYYQEAKNTFDEHYRIRHQPLKTRLLDLLPGHTQASLTHITDFYHVAHAQHSMKNMLKAILADTNLMYKTFEQLLRWARAQNEFNHE